jgi:hypothetical protein
MRHPTCSHGFIWPYWFDTHVYTYIDTRMLLTFVIRATAAHLLYIYLYASYRKPDRAHAGKASSHLDIINTDESCMMHDVWFLGAQMYLASSGGINFFGSPGPNGKPNNHAALTIADHWCILYFASFHMIMPAVRLIQTGKMYYPMRFGACIIFAVLLGILNQALYAPYCEAVLCAGPGCRPLARGSLCQLFESDTQPCTVGELLSPTCRVFIPCIQTCINTFRIQALY